MDNIHVKNTARAMNTSVVDLEFAAKITASNINQFGDMKSFLNSWYERETKQDGMSDAIRHLELAIKNLNELHTNLKDRYCFHDVFYEMVINSAREYSYKKEDMTEYNRFEHLKGLSGE